MTLAGLKQKLSTLTATAIGEVLFGWNELLSQNRNKNYPIVFWSLGGSSFEKDARTSTIQKEKVFTITVFVIINFDPDTQSDITVWDTLEGYFDTYINKMNDNAALSIDNIAKLKGEYIPAGLIPSIDAGKELGLMFRDIVLHTYCNDPVVTEDDVLSPWHQPSIDEMDLMDDNLHKLGLGSFTNDLYWSSTEVDNLGALAKSMTDSSEQYTFKVTQCRVRACRQVVSTNLYALRSAGASGGLYFYVSAISNGVYTYLEAAPADQSAGKEWSNVIDEEVTGTVDTVLNGIQNTVKIIAQTGHTDSSAKLCYDLP